MIVTQINLTGESSDLPRNVNENRVNVFDSPNLVLYGALCTSGSGTGIVIRTGNNTVFGLTLN